MFSAGPDGEQLTQWASAYLQGELGTVGQLKGTAFEEGEALSEKYGVTFQGVGEIELQEV
jgi:hypothetical protein